MHIANQNSMVMHTPQFFFIQPPSDRNFSNDAITHKHILQGQVCSFLWNEHR